MNGAQEIKCKMNDLKVLLNRITIKSFILLLIEILHEAGIRLKILIKIHMKKKCGNKLDKLENIKSQAPNFCNNFIQFTAVKNIGNHCKNCMHNALLCICTYL